MPTAPTIYRVADVLAEPLALHGLHAPRAARVLARLLALNLARAGGAPLGSGAATPD